MGGQNVPNRIESLSGVSLVIGAMTLALLLGVASPARGISCTATGSFIFTVVGGYGTLDLSADGSATMTLTPGHGSFCETCDVPPRILTGTFRTAAVDEDRGPCGFLLELAERSGRTVRINGVVAFRGGVLMFGPATDPENFGAGLALRSDTLTGQ